jgi:hypothetical protein
MTTKTGSSELLNFRPGDLAGRIEGVAQRNGCSKSDVIRNAIEMYLDLEPLEPLATYLGAAAYFVGVASAAAELGLFSRESYVRLVEAIEPTEQQVREKLEPLFRQIYPGAMTPGEFYAWKCKESLRRQRKGETDLTDDEMTGPEHVERWNYACFFWEEQFKDLKKARRLLLRRGRGDAPDVTGIAPSAAEARGMNDPSTRQGWPFRSNGRKKGASIDHPEKRGGKHK